MSCVLSGTAIRNTTSNQKQAKYTIQKIFDSISENLKSSGETLDLGYEQDDTINLEYSASATLQGSSVIVYLVYSNLSTYYTYNLYVSGSVKLLLF